LRQPFAVSSLALLGLALALAQAAPAQGTSQARCLNLTDPALALPPAAASLPQPLMFVAQMPLEGDMFNRHTTFGNHLASTSAAGRGGDLYILYPPSASTAGGCLRNLTREAGFGSADELQSGEAPIAVREPSLHWDGERALFSMATGAPNGPNLPTFHWQIYELEGLAWDAPLRIERIAQQPAGFNNVSPVYGAEEGTIYFTSDVPRVGPQALHLYPQQDEYERAPTVTGLWRLRLDSGEIELMSHAPSGSFSPLVDSGGRLILSRWDHLQRDIFASIANRFESEAPNAAQRGFVEHFPEPLEADPAQAHPMYGGGHRFIFKHFFLWELRADGSGEEILNHLGRHELAFFFQRNFTAAGNGLSDFTHPRGRDGSIENMLHPAEDPTQPFRYVFVDAPHFKKQSSGRLLAVSAPPGRSPDQIQLENITHPRGLAPSDPGYGGDRFRDPVPLADGRLLASHANPCSESALAPPACDDTADLDPDPQGYRPNYVFRLRLLRDVDGDGYLDAAEPVAPLLQRRLRLWGVQQGREVVYEGPLSQIDAIEVRARSRPPVSQEPDLPAPESLVFQQEGVDPERFRDYLRRQGLGLIVVRDATTRDANDRQQPVNLKVAGSSHVSDSGTGQLFETSHLEILRADLVSGYAFQAGRRALAVPLHGTAASLNPPDRRHPQHPSRIAVSGADGSVAAFVPTRRALSWQLLDPEGTPLVRERYWITLQPGEIRACSSCHGLNSVDQLGRSEPQHPPEALRHLLSYWTERLADGVFADGYEPSE
jgi:hypothetical protein